MTAAIVFHEGREVRSERSVASSYRFDGDEHLRQIGDGAPVNPGDLWEREAERDAQAHGKPQVHIYREDWRRGPTLQSGAWPAAWRRYIAAEVERRRPEMRLARTTNEGKH